MYSKKCLLIIILGIALFVINTRFGVINFATDLKSSEIFYDPPIIIDSDSDFSSMGILGTGDAYSPYVISDFIIDVSGFLNDGIRIEGTSKFFIIENCTIYTDYIGIQISNVAQGTAIIRNNTCISKSHDGGGIGVSGTDIIIMNNTCQNFAQGIHANQASSVKIYNNTIKNSTYQGINIRYTSNSIISGNIISDCREYAITVVKSSSTNNVIFSNVMEHNTYADEVNVDGINRGNPHSQAFDEGVYNLWYNATTQSGNCWSDYKGRGTYSIDGVAGSFDEYPNNCFGNRSIPGFIGFGVIFAVLIVLVSLCSKRRIK